MGEHEGGFQIRRKQVVDNCSSDWAEIIKYFPIVSHFFRKFEYSKSELIFCGITANFFQRCFISETQILMAVFDI